MESTELATVISCIPSAAPMGFPELIRAWLAGRKETTRRAYAGDLENFADFLGAQSGAEAASMLLGNGHGHANGLVLSYRASMQEAGLSSATIARRLSAVRSLVTLARMLGLVAWTLEIEAPKVESYRDTRGPGQAGFLAMIQAAQAGQNPTKAARDRAILMLLYVLALRRAEVISLRLEDFKPSEDSLWILGKGRSDRERITTPASVRDALASWVALRGLEPGPLFLGLAPVHSRQPLTEDGLYFVVRTLGASVGLDVRPHGLRHSGITAALDATGGDLRSVQRYSRHRDVRTLSRYDDNRQDLGGMVAGLVAARAV